MRAKYLKRRARKLYLAIMARNDLDCGAKLTEFIRPDIAILKAEFNQTMAELAKLDPAAKALIETNGELV
jgi:hypothetical protein